MSSRIILIGDTLSGKSTIAALIALQLAKIRGLTERPLAILTRPTSAYTPYPVDVCRTRTLNGLISKLHSAGAPAILDDCSEMYALLVDSWRDQSSVHRDERGLPRKVRLSPDEWNVINSKYRSVFAVASEIAVDVVEIHRRGPVYVSDADLGMVEGEGVKARGQAESGGGGDLVILLDGGLRARRRETGSRVLTVLSDLSGKLNGRELRLPQIASPEDRKKLERDLAKFLRPSLEAVVKWADAEAIAWKIAKDREIPDSWSEAKEAAQRANSAVIAGQVKALIDINGLGGMKAEDKAARAGLLFETFEVGDVDSLSEVPSEILRGKLPFFRIALDRLKATRSGGAA